MVYNFVNTIVFLYLNSIFSILNAIMGKHRFLTNESTKFLEVEPRGFLQIVLRFDHLSLIFLKTL